MIMEERIRNLQSFGYTAAEAGFLTQVALYSGYFVRRHFDTALGVQRGKRTQVFIDKLLSRGHVRRSLYQHNNQVFHLHFKPFYAAIGDQDSRNRRDHQPPAIRTRLMGLDYILVGSASRWLSTEKEKVNYFVLERSVLLEQLPTKYFAVRGRDQGTGRCFVDRFPISVSSDTGAVSFCYVDGGEETEAALTTHLRHYRRLFEALNQFEFVFIGTPDSRFDAAETMFRRVILGEKTPAMREAEFEQILTYFRDQRLFDLRETQSFDRKRLDRFRDLRNQFRSPFHLGLYKLFLEKGEAAVREELQPAPPINGRFTPYRLPHNYAFLRHLDVAS
jgi:hypothetical protein